MSVQPLLTDTRISDLPVVLQSYILSFLCDENPYGSLKLSQRRPKFKQCLECAKTVSDPLPRALLPVAQASNRFSVSVADLLGPRAKYLTMAATNDQLAEWVAALGPFVRAVSTYDHKLETLQRDTSLSHQFPVSQHVFKKSLALLEVLSRKNVRLRVLDIKSTPLGNCKSLEHDLLSKLVSALDQSSSTLKELALPVTKMCAKALKRVTLKKLEVLNLELRELDGATNIVRTEIGRSAEAFMKMFRALEQGAGPYISKLRDLRLKHVHEAPCVDVEPSGCTVAFFNSIKILCVVVVRSGNHDNDSVAMFISLFSNLERLDWNGAVTQNHLKRINSSCPKLQQLHLRPYTQFNSSFSFSPMPEPDGSVIRDMLLASQGKMKTLMLKGLLKTEHVKLLGENCPGLEHLRIELGRANVEGLPMLLGSHCRYIRRLEVPVMSYLSDSLATEHWHTFTDAVGSASDHLTELSIWADNGSIPLDVPVETMMQSILHVLKSLGERARVVRFRLCLLKGRYQAVIEGLCHILRTCAKCSRRLERLEAQFRISSCCYAWDSEEKEEEMLLRLGRARQNLVEETPRLRSLSLGPLNRNARMKLEEMEV